VLIQGGSDMTGADLCVSMYKSVPVIFEPPCSLIGIWLNCFLVIWQLSTKDILLQEHMQ